MKPFPHEGIRLVERILREHPDRVEELKVLNTFISSRCHSTSQEPPTTHNTPSSSPQERIIEAKESHAYYRWLCGCVEQVNIVMDVLTDEEQKLIKNIYWQGRSADEVADEMEVARATMYRLKNRIISDIGPILAPQYMSLWKDEAKMRLESQGFS